MRTLESGRKAAQRRAWDEAREALTEVDEKGDLDPDDLELLADAAWWSGHADQAVEAMERAYLGYVETGRPTDGARVAVFLAYFAMRRLAYSIGAGWRAKADRLLEGEPESAAHAYAKMIDVAEAFIHRDDIEDTIRLADEAIDLARRTNNRDAEGEARAFKGVALLSGGMWQEGLKLLDEASASALAGDLSLRSASDVYCITIAACRSLADFGRAAEWTEEADRWMSRQSVGGYPGICKVHRAELKRLKGAWGEAEAEALDACKELERYRIFDGVGTAHYEVGEIRLRMGDLAGAEEKFNKAYEYGLDPQPGAALLMLARGKAEDAARMLTRALAEKDGERRDQLARARLLPAHVEVSLAIDDLEAAKTSAEEIERIAGEFDRPAFAAMAANARGEIALHEGDPVASSLALEKAWRLWRDLGFPYETAQARLLLGRAHLMADDPTRARLELEAARAQFAELGAALALRRAEESIRELAGDPPRRTRVVKVFMFTDIVTSTELIGVIGDSAWESLLAWHDRELRAAFAAHRGQEVSHTGDGFFAVFDTVPDAVEAAAAIQRRLADQRREHGFAPSVRIGIHLAEATAEGSDFRGQGVHAAARVGSVADADEIVISAAALDAAGSLAFPVSMPTTVELKGIREPMPVHRVDWRQVAETD